MVQRCSTSVRWNSLNNIHCTLKKMVYSIVASLGPRKRWSRNMPGKTSPGLILTYILVMVCYVAGLRLSKHTCSRCCLSWWMLVCVKVCVLEYMRAYLVAVLQLESSTRSVAAKAYHNMPLTPTLPFPTPFNSWVERKRHYPADYEPVLCRQHSSLLHLCSTW